MIDIGYGESGIYKITNIVNGKIYIGQSVDIKRRITGHNGSLRREEHQNSYLQYSYNKHGEESFAYEVLELCNRDELTEKENHWMEFYKSYNNKLGYNLHMPGTAEVSHTKSVETRKKISDTKTLFSKDELISYLQEFYYMEGRTPNQRDFSEKKYGEYPSFTVFYQNFGSLKNALIEADLFDFVGNKEQFDQKEYTNEEMLELYSLFIKRNGRLPSTKERRSAIEHGLVSESAIVRRFGSFQLFKKELGMTKEKEIKLENESSIKMLRELFDLQGFITARSIDKSKLTRSVKFYSNRFGSLFNAYELAGIDPEKNPVKGHSYLGNYEKFNQTEK